MQLFTSLLQMQRQARKWRKQGKRIGLVPTMGSLHEGHLSLVEIAQKQADVSVVSIFVNPIQFGPKEDFTKYPRDTEGDLQKLKRAGVDAVFLPISEEIYPPDFQTTVHLSKITQGLCSKTRPGHFDGVTTVVLKLFHIVEPHVAVFGEKDYQQLAVIRQMTKDLNLPLEVIGGPIIRSAEGLALSSRNIYLSIQEKKEALCLFQAIQLVQKFYQEGKTETQELIKIAKKFIEKFNVQSEYLEMVDASTLEPLKKLDRPARFLLAVQVGKTRLIDNGPVQP